MLRSSFGVLAKGGALRTVLCVVRASSFAVFDVHDPLDIHRLLERRERGVRSVAVVPASAAPAADGPLASCRGDVLAVAAEGAAGGTDRLRFLSLDTNEFVHEHTAVGPIDSVLSNGAQVALVEAGRLELLGADASVPAVRVDDVFERPDAAVGAASPQPCSLAERLLAYPCASLPAAPADGGGGSVLGGIVELAVSSAGALSGVSPREESAAGCVRVVDAGRPAAAALFHFRAHASAVAALKLNETDRGGCLLASAGESGRSVKVWMLADGTDRPELLYRLERGVTAATIAALSFAASSRWLALSTTRGTTHVFSINAVGGTTDASTHVTSASLFTPEAASSYDPKAPPALVTKNADAVLKGDGWLSSQVESAAADGDHRTSAVCTRFVASDGDSLSLLSCCKNKLLAYSLEATAPGDREDSAIAPASLALEPRLYVDSNNKTQPLTAWQIP